VGGRTFRSSEAGVDTDALDWRAAQEEWENPDNWRLLGTYASPRDPRVWVRKREPSFGWTLNFAHTAAWFWLLGLVGVPVALVLMRVASAR
jgi:uncharacterized membrane protein